MLRSRETWLYSLLEKVLRGEKGRWLKLLDKSAETVIFGDDRIKYAKVDMYHYQMEGSLLELMTREKEGFGLVETQVRRAAGSDHSL